MNISQTAEEGKGHQIGVLFKGSASIVENEIEVMQFAGGNEVKQTGIAVVE